METIKALNGQEYQKTESGTYYRMGTPQELINTIETIRTSGERIRVFLGSEGKTWNEESFTVGRIGRSTGTIQIPLLLHNARSMGGTALLDNRIVRIISTKTGRVLYSNPAYKMNVFLREDLAVTVNGEIYAQCDTEKQANRLAQFMNGVRHSR